MQFRRRTLRQILPIVVVSIAFLASMQAQQTATDAPPASWKIALSADTHLDKMPHVSIKVHNGHTNKDETYSGIPLVAVLAKVGAPVGKDLHGKALSNYVVVSGSDGYEAVLSLAEVDPEFHPGHVIVADELDGNPLGKDGPYKLVVSEDKHPARWVRNLVSIEVKSAAE